MLGLQDCWGINKIFAALGIENSQAQSFSRTCHFPGGNVETLKLDCCWVWVPVVDGGTFIWDSV